MMQMSIHYYVLSLNEQMCRLYEGFRDQLIDIQNTNFPFTFLPDAGSTDKLTSKVNQLKDFFYKADQHFDHYYQQDSLHLAIVGGKKNLILFNKVTTHRDIILGTVKGDYLMTSPYDLGKIVWPIVKRAIAGTNKNAMRDLGMASKARKIISGIDAVGLSAETETGSTLFVEDDYHVKGSFYKTGHSLIRLNYVDIREVIDDVVDIIIEKVLKTGGNVIFLDNGSLAKLQRIALILNN